MDKEWITVFGTLGGIIVGGIVGYFAKNLELKHLRQSEAKKNTQAKLEELHERISEYLGFSSAYANNVLKLEASAKGFFKPKLNVNSISEYMKITDSLAQPLTRISTLLKIYAPDLKPEFFALVDAVGNLHTHGAAFFTSKTPQAEFLQYNQIVINACNLILEKLENRMQKDMKKEF